MCVKPKISRTVHAFSSISLQSLASISSLTTEYKHIRSSVAKFLSTEVPSYTTELPVHARTVRASSSSQVIIHEAEGLAEVSVILSKNSKSISELKLDCMKSFLLHLWAECFESKTSEIKFKKKHASAQVDFPPHSCENQISNAASVDGLIQTLRPRSFLINANCK